MNRMLLLLFLAAGAFSGGCTRNSDPLAWRIEGRHLGDLQESFDDISRSLPPGLDREFAFAINNIMANIRSNHPGSQEELDNRVCRRIRGKSVRDILIEGNDLARELILSRLNTESGYLLRLIEQSDRYSDAQRQALPARIEIMESRIAWLKDMLAKSNRRLAELYGSAAHT